MNDAVEQHIDGEKHAERVLERVDIDIAGPDDAFVALVRVAQADGVPFLPSERVRGFMRRLQKRIEASRV